MSARLARLRRVAAVLLVAMLGACAHREASSQRLSLAGALGSLGADPVNGPPLAPRQLEGKVVLVTFLATWCFPCLVDLPALERLQLEHGSTGFQNIAVGMDLEGKTMLEPFARQYALSYPLMVASAPLLAGQTPVGRIRELPTRVLFGGDGQVLGAYAGLLPWSTLQHAVIEALRARTSAQRSAGGSRQGR